MFDSLDLIDSLVPGSIDYSVIIESPSEYEEKLQNAKYDINCTTVL